MRVKIMAESADHTMKVVPEWTHPVRADGIDGTSKHFKIKASEDALKNLCRRLDLVEISALSANFILKRENKRVVKVRGVVEADVVQSCIISLQPVAEHVQDRFEAWYADPVQAVSFARARHEREKEMSEQERPMLEEHEDPEPIIDGIIDLGELATQYLSLALNPYPQTPEALKELEGMNDEEKHAKENPFAALKDLKDKK